MAYNGTVPAEGVWVQFYGHDAKDDSPLEDLFAQYVVSPDEFTVTKIDTPLSFPACWRVPLLPDENSDSKTVWT